MNKDFFIKQLDDILNDFNKIKSKAQYDDLSGNVSIEEISAVLTKAKAAISRIVGDNSEYYKDIEATLKRANIHEGNKLRHIAGIVSALRSDLENDYLKSFTDIIQSEVFSDYLEMANHLLNEGYKDPAAVLIGSTLEVHLRELCISNNIDIEVTNNKGNRSPKKADLMNADLAKANIYSSAYQKQIIAWLDLRNKAAHGKYSDYKVEEVSLMLQGIRQFILATK
ncbi:hypothetical protein [Flavobacterium sp.]|jgi:hypothetical protein|uniref:hypothetical protein n=1 Tax=Flavobacterium sp. TaxID=239 RepID=UPI0037BFAFDF